MKTIFILLICCITLSAFSQTKTVALGKNNYKTFQVKGGDDTYVITIPVTDLTSEDTLFVDGDTILTVYDTVIYLLKWDFPASLHGIVISKSDTISGYGATMFTNAEIQLKGAACSNCEYYPIASGQFNGIVSGGNFNFNMKAIRMKIVFIVGDPSTGRITSNIILKSPAIN